MTIRNVVNTRVLTVLDGAGLHKAVDNLFSLDGEPAISLHTAYCLSRPQATLLQASSSTTVYNPMRLTVRVAWCWSASTNVSATYSEAVLDLMDQAEALESALTTGPGDADGVSVSNWEISPVYGGNWLALDIEITINTEITR